MRGKISKNNKNLFFELIVNQNYLIVTQPVKGVVFCQVP